MNHFFQTVFTRYPIKTKRFLEILPGLTSWSLILFPVWGSLLIPTFLAYFILFFDMFWLYKSFSLAITAFIASKKIKVAEATDWLEKAKGIKHFDKVNHVVIFPNYKETVYKLRASIQTLADQTLSPKKLYVVLAMEQREENAKEKADTLIKEFEGVFGALIPTYHPDIDGEVKGKSSNESYAAKQIDTMLFDTKKLDLHYSTISTVDADSLFDKQYFAYLTYEFLTQEKRHNLFWQSANPNYNNFWSVPAPVRILAFFSGLWRTSLLIQEGRLIANSTYSLSYVMLKKVGFWDTDVVPEDYRIFFKAFYKLQGNLWIRPIFLNTSMDAPLSSTYWKSIMNKYQQERRWSWGVSDDPLFIKWWFTVPGIPFMRKTLMLYHVLLDHFLWPVNWFIITVAANIIAFVNPVFSRTTLGYKLPELAGFILTCCTVALFTMIIVDLRNRPNSASASKIRQFLFPFEFVLLPIVGFFLSTLPALISHTQLMLGKRLEYRVTEKV